MPVLVALYLSFGNPDRVSLPHTSSPAAMALQDRFCRALHWILTEMHWDSENGWGITSHFTSVLYKTEATWFRWQSICRVHFSFKIYLLTCLLGHSLSLALTLRDTTDKKARLFPQGGCFDMVSNGNSYHHLSFVILSCSPKGYRPELNSTFPVTAQQLGYFHRQGTRLVAGGHC